MWLDNSLLLLGMEGMGKWGLTLCWLIYLACPVATVLFEGLFDCIGIVLELWTKVLPLCICWDKNLVGF